MESIWYQSVEIPERGALAGNCRVDAAVVGGGLAGILTAWFLKQAGMNVLVVEGNRVGSGQTGKTTAKITVSHNLIYEKLIKKFGEERARQYADANQDALRQYRRLIKEEHISCDFRNCPSYLYSVQDKEMIERETEAARKLGLPVEYTTQTELPFSVEAALRYENQACFHPLKFIRYFAEKLDIVEHTPVERVVENQVFTSHGTIEAEHIIFATHYPFINVPGYYFMRMHQERSYVAALTGCSKLDGMYLGVDPALPVRTENRDGKGLSFRSYDHYLLLGGYGHRTGENCDGGQYSKLRSLAKSYWQNCEMVSCWSAQDGMTVSGMPYIGRYSSRKSNWYVAAGFQKWGMTSSMASAMILSSMIQGKTSMTSGVDVFSPQNLYLFHSMPKLMKEGVSASKHLLHQNLVIPGKMLKDISVGQGGKIWYRGKKLGVYKNEKGKIYFVTTRCPHLGCELSWNPEERSWDCPCHGSRFDYQGNLLDNPAQRGIHIRFSQSED